MVTTVAKGKAESVCSLFLEMNRCLHLIRLLCKKNLNYIALPNRHPSFVSYIFSWTQIWSIGFSWDIQESVETDNLPANMVVCERPGQEVGGVTWLKIAFSLAILHCRDWSIFRSSAKGKCMVEIGRYRLTFLHTPAAGISCKKIFE